MKEWCHDQLVDDCHELRQGIMFCALCCRTEKVTGYSLIEDGWRYCCTKPMNLLPRLPQLRWPFGFANRYHYHGPQ